MVFACLLCFRAPKDASVDAEYVAASRAAGGDTAGCVTRSPRSLGQLHAAPKRTPSCVDAAQPSVGCAPPLPPSAPPPVAEESVVIPDPQATTTGASPTADQAASTAAALVPPHDMAGGRSLWPDGSAPLPPLPIRGSGDVDSGALRGSCALGDQKPAAGRHASIACEAPSPRTRNYALLTRQQTPYAQRLVGPGLAAKGAPLQPLAAHAGQCSGGPRSAGDHERHAQLSTSADQPCDAVASSRPKVQFGRQFVLPPFLDSDGSGAALTALCSPRTTGPPCLLARQQTPFPLKQRGWAWPDSWDGASDVGSSAAHAAHTVTRGMDELELCVGSGCLLRQTMDGAASTASGPFATPTARRAWSRAGSLHASRGRGGLSRQAPLAQCNPMSASSSCAGACPPQPRLQRALRVMVSLTKSSRRSSVSSPRVVGPGADSDVSLLFSTCGGPVAVQITAGAAYTPTRRGRRRNMAGNEIFFPDDAQRLGAHAERGLPPTAREQLRNPPEPPPTVWRAQPSTSSLPLLDARPTPAPSSHGLAAAAGGAGAPTLAASTTDAEQRMQHALESVTASIRHTRFGGPSSNTPYAKRNVYSSDGRSLLESEPNVQREGRRMLHHTCTGSVRSHAPTEDDSAESLAVLDPDLKACGSDKLGDFAAQPSPSGVFTADLQQQLQQGLIVLGDPPQPGDAWQQLRDGVHAASGADGAHVSGAVCALGAGSAGVASTSSGALQKAGGMVPAMRHPLVAEMRASFSSTSRLSRCSSAAGVRHG